MRRIAFLLLTLSLLAVGCEVGALCVTAQAMDGPCCCPMTMDDTMDGSAPCMEESGDASTPADTEAIFDGAAQAFFLPSMAAVPLAVNSGRGLDRIAVRDPAAGHGPALYLRGCSLLN